MKLSVNEAKLIGLWAGNCATIQQVLNSKLFVFGPEKFLGLSRNGVQKRTEVGGKSNLLSLFRNLSLLVHALVMFCDKQERSQYPC